MPIDGKKIAQEILDGLKLRVDKLKSQGITPHLHIITLTTDEASNAYVGQKVKKGKEIGEKITVENLSEQTSTGDLLKRIEELNQDKNVHGIIVQRPMPEQIAEEAIANAINPDKDVDGFHKDSKFDPPIAEAVLEILKSVSLKTGDLKNKKIAVVGRGITAGGPIIRTLEKLGTKPEVISSQTTNKEEILKSSDIVIGAVGKSGIVKGDGIKNGAILVGVGMFRGEDGKFQSDYDEEDIKDVASYYTPTPGGTGPVNVAMLLSNLIKSAENQML